MRREAALLLLLLGLPRPSSAQQPDTAGAPTPARPAGQALIEPDSAAPRAYFFAHPERDYGSDAIRSPADVWLNRGLSVIVFDDEERALGRIRWASGWTSVRNAFAHPRRAVQRAGGLRPWLKREYLPSGGRVWLWAWAPNYSGHMLAGGITNRFLGEWFEAQGVPAPRVAAAIFYMATMVTNEMVESQGGGPGNASSIADLAINDPIGMVLFSFDGPTRFFAQKLQVADWSPQATITFPEVRVLNSSQMLSYKIPLPGTHRVKVLMVLGQAAATGLQVGLRDGYHIGAVGGFQTKRREVNADTGEESITPAWGGGLYLDRNNSLLASAVLGRRAFDGVQVNVFPGVLPGVLRSAGVWASCSEGGDWGMGVAFRRTLGVGLGANVAR